MHRSAPGHCVTVTTGDEPFKAFVPAPLPPDPPIEWSPALRRRFDAALVALGWLDAVTGMLPNASLVLYSFIRKEAVLSSQIEGTQSSISDLLLYEIDEQPGVPVDDAKEVSRCVAALETGLKKLKGGLPLCTRLLCEMHKTLLAHPRGRAKAPGELRRSQVWIGGTRPGNAVFVPPPADVRRGFPKSVAFVYSRFIRAMPAIEISFGQTASHSPSFEQLPKPSSSMRSTMAVTRRSRSGCPCGSAPRCAILAEVKSAADAFLHAATQAPQAMHCA